MQKNPLFHFSWNQYVILLFMMLGVGFFASGVLTWLAANWDAFSTLQKLYGTQALFFITLILGYIFYYRESRKSQRRLITSSFFFLSAVLIGAIFALIGQTYQTGADTWQLFATWSVCQFPFLLLFPNLASAILFSLTSNITLFLLADFLPNYSLYGLVALNLIFLVLSEITGAYFKDTHWRVLPKVSTLLFVVACFWLFANNKNLTWTWLLVAGGIFYYKIRRFDFLILVMLFIYAIISFNMNFLMDALDGIFAVTVTTFLSSIAGIYLLSQWFKQHYPEREKMTWHIYPLYILLMLFCCLLLIFSLFFTFELEQERDLVYPAVIFLVIGAFLHFTQGENKKGEVFVILLDTIVAVGVTLYFAFFLFMEYESISFFSMLAIFVFFYVIRTAPWLRFLLAALLIVGMLFYLGFFYQTFEDNPRWGQVVFSLPDIFILLGIVLYYDIFSREESQVRDFLLPLAWASVLVCLNLFNIDTLLSFNRFQVAPELPKIMGGMDWFHLVTNRFFETFSLDQWLWKTVQLLIAFSPLFIFLRLNKHFESINKGIMVSCFVIMGIGLIANNAILAYLALSLLAYLSCSRIMFAVAVLGIVTNLSIYYYALQIPLLYKSYLLLGFAVFFVVITWLLFRQLKEEKITEQATQSPRLEFGTLSKVKLILASVVVFGIGFFVNHSIYKYEDVLRTGTPVLLKIAPKDPRSLIQGDYIRLNYEILDEINSGWLGELNSTQNYFIYALLKRDELGVMSLCRLTEKVPKDFSGCVEQVYLPVKVSYFSPRLPSQDYFFAEGKGEYYAQAEYVEYRFKKGIILLHRLLDKNLKVL